MQIKYLKYDLYRYFYPNNSVNRRPFLEKVKIVCFTLGIWAIIEYRIARWLKYDCKIKLLIIVLSPIAKLTHLFINITTGIGISKDADIGPGLYIGHFGSIIIGPTKIGKFCNISQENAIGYAGRKNNYGIPEIGDFVYVAPGAKVVGKIKIGNYVAIGANTVVTKDINDYAVVVGNPGVAKNYNGSSDFIMYNGLLNKEIL